MIPMSCPSCGRRGNVPLDRLNTRMHCKKCDAVFHLDATGKPVLGEPPSAKGKGGKGGKGGRPKNEPLDPIGIVATKIANAPRGVWYTVGGLLGIYLIYFAYTLYGPQPVTPRDQLISQSEEAANAFIRKDVAALQEMATSDSKAEVATLIETFRTQVGDQGAKPEEMPPAVTSEIPPRPDEKPQVEVSIQPPTGPDGKAPPIFYLDLVWVYANGKFYLNGKGTLEANQERLKLRKEAEAKAGKKR